MPESGGRRGGGGRLLGASGGVDEIPARWSVPVAPGALAAYRSSGGGGGVTAAGFGRTTEGGPDSSIPSA